MKKIIRIVATALLGLSACSTQVQTNPARTATEELLISTAAERASSQLTLAIPPNATVFIDNSNFDGTDSKYAVAQIRTNLLQNGVRLVDDKKSADVVVETRAGALSTDRDTFLIGIPSFNVPIPFTSAPLPFPQLALYGTEDQEGVAKFAVTALDAKKGTLIAAQDPQYGFSHNKKTTLLIFISWSRNDAVPEGIDQDEVPPPGSARPQNWRPHTEVSIQNPEKP